MFHNDVLFNYYNIKYEYIIINIIIKNILNKDFKEDTKQQNVHCKELIQSIVESKGFKTDCGVAVSKLIGRENTVDTYVKEFTYQRYNETGN